MNEKEINDNVGDYIDQDLLSSIGDHYWGKYLINRFFIQIKTGKKRSDISSYNFEKDSFSLEDQLKLQLENFPAIFHEYFHYLHEVSTMAGTLNFYYHLINRAYFSIYAVETSGSEYPSIELDILKLMNANRLVFKSLDGHRPSNLASIKILRIVSIELYPFNAKLSNYPEQLVMRIPVVQFEAYDLERQVFYTDEITFGKFYLYEGIAHHVENLVHVEMGSIPENQSTISAEYLLMEKVAEHIVPDISVRAMLEIATLSLSYMNCGEFFIGFLNDVATNSNRAEVLQGLKKQTQDMLRENLTSYTTQFEGLTSAVRGRQPLINAVDYLSKLMIANLKRRIENPIFEIDVVYSGRLDDIVNYVTMSPMIYEFDEDFDIIKRDYAGTYLNDLGNDMLTFLGYLDYFYAGTSNIENHPCPLYTACNHPLRIAKGEQCKTKPRLAYEDKSIFGWCHYGLGVAYHKCMDEGVEV
jgi:hypothetical protein